MNARLGDLYSEILGTYQEIDRKTARLQGAAGMMCPPGCGFCCENDTVEATVIETLPLAYEIYLRGEEETVSLLIEKKESEGDSVCVIYRADLEIPGNGRCSCYDFRPLLCRLFAFASRRNKQGQPELCACKIIRRKAPDAVRRAEIGIAAGLEAPAYQDAFMRIASLDPSMGYRRLPINLAIKEALEFLYWKRPRGLRKKRWLRSA